MIPRDHNEIAVLCREAILDKWDTPIYEFSKEFTGILQDDDNELKILFRDWVDACNIKPNGFSNES